MGAGVGVPCTGKIAGTGLELGRGQDAARIAHARRMEHARSSVHSLTRVIRAGCGSAELAERPDHVARASCPEALACAGDGLGSGQDARASANAHT